MIDPSSVNNLQVLFHGSLRFNDKFSIFFSIPKLSFRLSRCEEEITRHESVVLVQHPQLTEVCLVQCELCRLQVLLDPLLGGGFGDDHSTLVKTKRYAHL